MLAALPLERVWELHLARADLVDGVWLDAHSGAIDPQLKLRRHAVHEDVGVEVDDNVGGGAMLRERAEGVLDDIDHLGNRRIRLVGELLTNQVYIGLIHKL